MVLKAIISRVFVQKDVNTPDKDTNINQQFGGLLDLT